MNHKELQKRLIKCSTPMERIEIIWEYYEKNTQIELSRPPSIKQRKKIEEWFKLNSKKENFHLFDIRELIGFTRQIINGTLQEKAIHIGQHSCRICDVVMDENSNMPLNHSFPIPIDPWSAQSSSNNTNIRKAVYSELRNYSINCCTNYPICINIVALVSQSSRKKDVDNIAKGLLDSMEGIVYKNDSQVQCLQVRRLEYAGSIGYYSVSVRAVYPWDIDVIYNSSKAPKIGYGNPITIND